MRARAGTLPSVAADRMHEDELAVDEALVGRLLAAQFPAWAGLPLARVPSTGTVNALYRIGDDLCVRLPRLAAWAGDIATELRWLPALGPRLPLAAPEPVAAGAPTEAFPHPWGVYRWLPGAPLDEAPPADTVAAAAALGRFVAALRALPTDGAPAAGRGKPLAPWDGGMRRAIAAAGHVVDAAAAAAAWAAALRAPAWDGPPVWLHGDLLPANLLVDGGRLAAVIDWGNVGVGDPACDLVPAWCAFDGAARRAFRAAAGADDATWARAQGWALAIALPIIPYYAETNPAFVAMATRLAGEAVRDPGADG